MITAVILTKNEDGNIKRCLDSVKFSDEIIVIDDNSTDKTVQICKDCGANIITRNLNNDFAGQRNFGIEKAKGDWILFVDADEEVSNELREEIKSIVIASDPPFGGERGNLVNGIASAMPRNDTKISAYCLKRRDSFWGKEMKYGETKKVRETGLIRLFKKNSGQWTGLVHEEFKPKSQPTQLNSYLNHYPHPTVKDYLQEVNFYSTLRAKELYQKGIKTNIFEIIAFPTGKFILTYLLKMGFLDGASGFAYSFFMSFHSFLVRAKLYQYWNIDNH